MYIIISAALLFASTVAAAACEACPSRAKTMPAWTIRNLNYNASQQYTNPAHDMGIAYLDFSVYNPITNEEHHCSNTSTLSYMKSFFQGMEVMTCLSDDGKSTVDGLTYKFQSGSKVLSINQTYSCPGSDTKYMAEGTATLSKDMHCQEHSWQNPDWHGSPGQPGGSFYSTWNQTCDTFNGEVPVSTVHVYM